MSVIMPPLVDVSHTNSIAIAASTGTVDEDGADAISFNAGTATYRQTDRPVAKIRYPFDHYIASWRSAALTELAVGYLVTEDSRLRVSLVETNLTGTSTKQIVQFDSSAFPISTGYQEQKVRSPGAATLDLDEKVYYIEATFSGAGRITLSAIRIKRVST